MTHDELARHLADHLRTERRMVWCDVQLGPAGSPRPDVFAIFKSFVSPSPTAYEVKVSRSDFLADVTSGKWQGYLRYAGAIYFAADRSLGLTKADVPTHCGLMIRGESGTWRAAKRAVVNPVDVPQEALLKLLIDGVEREGPRVRQRQWSYSLDKLRHQLGEDVASCVADLQRARADQQGAQHICERLVSSAREEAAIMRAAASEEAIAGPRGDLAAVLGLPRESNLWQIQQEIRRVKDRCSEPEQERRYRLLSDRIREAVKSLGFEPTAIDSSPPA